MADHGHIIPFIRKWEGGKSRAATDLASRQRLPAELDGVHTNKGVTWTTFLAAAGACGYEPTAKLFLKMPDEIWERIWKREYWDAVRGDEIQSQAAADAVAWWRWMSGAEGTRRVQRVLNAGFGAKLTADGVVGPMTLAAINAVKPERLTREILLARSAHYGEIVRANPGQIANVHGWMNGLLDFALYQFLPE